ncbi:MAG: serine/threonine-protein kinase, partial [Planctomycetota bacterium]|nr:serine/threonine-protein kinase [Planctomycetota bacterium]
MNHECPDSQHLATFVSQTLSPSDEANVGEHIASCVECSNLVARLRKQLPATLPDPTERDSPHPSNVRWDRVESGSQSFDLGHLGRFRLLKILGVGGMGYVFEAEDLKLERRVALKAMKPELARKQKARRRFLREARSVAAVTSDHIVAIHEVDENEDVPFLVMDLLKGRNLGSRLKSGTPDVMETLRIIREAATGLHAAHELGIIHRDIKPSNLWLEAGDDRVKVLDFGLALPVGVESDLTATDTMLGTPRYMSPEQVRGEELDARSDLFSLGSVMYELCSGTAAFPASNLRDTLFRITDTEPKSLGEIDPEIPLAVERIVQKLMAKNRDERFASAKELIGEINEVEYGLRTAVTSMYRRPISAGSESRSSRSSMLPSALCLVVVVVMVMAGLWQPWLVDAFSRNPSIDNPAPEKSTVDGADKVKGPIKPPRKKPPVIQVVSEFKHRGPVRAGAASPVDQTQVLSGDTDGSLLLWDIRNGAVIRDFGHREVPVHSVTFSESGKLVLVIDMLWKVQLVDARSGGMVAEFILAAPNTGI